MEIKTYISAFIAIPSLVSMVYADDVDNAFDMSDPRFVQSCLNYTSKVNPEEKYQLYILEVVCKNSPKIFSMAKKEVQEELAPLFAELERSFDLQNINKVVDILARYGIPLQAVLHDENELQRLEKAVTARLVERLKTAIQEENIEYVKRLLLAGADIRPSPRKHLLNSAVQTGNIEIVRMLLDKMCPLKESDAVPQKRSYRAKLTQLLSKKKLVKSLKSDGVNTPDNQNNTPLHLASLSGQKSMVELLVSYGATHNALESQLRSRHK